MTRTNCPGSGTAIIILALLMCSILAVAPAAALTQHLGEGPSFTATVTGVNEFVPGDDTTITILVKNTGLNSMKQVMMGTIQPEDQQNTAKTTTIGLGSAGDAVLIKTNPQFVGDIMGGNSVPVQYRVKISANATEGDYQLPLTLKYRYLKVIVQERADMFEFAYDDAEETLPVTVRIQPHVKAEVIGAVPEQLIPGSEGYLNLTIRNAGPENGTMASVKLIRNGQSPIIPASSTVFIGTYPSGGIVTCRYKVSVAKDATNQTYPVDLAVTYTNREGTIVTSSKTTVGVPVNNKPAFTIASSVPEVPRGTDQIVEIRYRNDGDITVHAAQARITPHNPITISDNNAYLGDIAPGASATATFKVQADSAADPAVYSLDSTIRFRDESDTSLESDTIPVQLKVVPAAPGIPPLAIAGGIIALVVIVIGFLVYRNRKQNR